MQDRVVREEFYIGRLYHREKDKQRWLSAEVTGERYKDGQWYDKREWHWTAHSHRAHRFPTEDYSAGKARAIFKVTKEYKYYVKRGYELQVIRVRVVHEMLQVGENANPLIQLALLAPEGDEQV